MKPFFNNALLIGLLYISASCTKQMSELVTDENAGINGSFEQVKTNLPVNWLVYTPNTSGEGDFDFSFDTKNAKEGKQCLKLYVKTCSAKGGWYSPGIAQEIPVKANEEYKISFWLKNSESTFKVNINCVSAKQESKSLTLNSSENIKEWRYYEYNYKVPNDMEKLRIEMNVIKPGTFWIDNFKISAL